MTNRLVHICALLLVFGITAVGQTVQDSIVALVPRGNEVYRWGYSELTDADKALYDTIVGSVIRFEANNYSAYYYHRVDLLGVPNTMSIQQLSYTLERISRDVPELYVLSSTVPRYDYSLYNYYARIGIVNTPERYLRELVQLRAVADTILAEVTPGMSDYEKLCILHDRFIEWGDYGDMTGADAGNIRGALLNKRAVCEGFARAGLYLCQRLGLECIFVSGQLQTSTVNDTWGNHAWNYVKLAGQWYLMDLTTDGGFPGIVGHEAFLRGAAYFNVHYRLLNAQGTNPNLGGIYQSLPVLSEEDYVPSATGLKDESEEVRGKNVARKVLKNGQMQVMTPQGRYAISGQEIR